MGLGIRAFAEFSKSNSDATLTMVGKGPDKKQWKLLAEKLGISDKITWIEWVEQEELKRLYKKHDLFLFPSLHDSGGMVVLEAMSQGLPVICLNLGGPDIIVDNNCGFKVSVEDKSESLIVEDLTSSMSKYADNTLCNKNLVEGALSRANEMSWSKAVNVVYRRDF
jgi:glycosyltransferase involved in cell wall biosynthesis